MTLLPHMVTAPDSIEYAIFKTGWREGTEALVAAWAERRRFEPRWEQTMDHLRTRYTSEYHHGVRFVIEWVYADIWALNVEWPEVWGHERVCTGHLQDMKEEVRILTQTDGPYGGPRLPRSKIWAIPQERVWRAAGSVELRLELLRDNCAAYFHISRYGGALNELLLCSFIESNVREKIALLETIQPSESRLWATVRGNRRSWTFTTWRPVLACMSLGEQELLLLSPELPTIIILAHTAGHLQAAMKIDRNDLYRFDASWLAGIRTWPNERSAVVHDLVGCPPRPASYSAPAPRGSPTPSASSSPARTPEVAFHPAVPTSSRPTAPPSSPRATEAVPRPAGSATVSPPRPSPSPPTPTRGAARPHFPGSDAVARPAGVGHDAKPAVPTSPSHGTEAVPRPGIGRNPSPAGRPSTSPPVTTAEPVPTPAPAIGAVDPLGSSRRPPTSPPDRSLGSAPASPHPTNSPPATTTTTDTAPTSPQPTDSPASASPRPTTSRPPPTASSPPPTASSPPPTAEDAPAPPHVSEAAAAISAPSTNSAPHVDSAVPKQPKPRKPRPRPRFPLAESASPAEIERHFAEIEATIPPLLTGSATAVAIWQAIREAHRHGALPITGGWIDLVSALHRRGWLPHLPGDRATRDALSILESLSPLVRRLHHRRWVLGVER